MAPSVALRQHLAARRRRPRGVRTLAGLCALAALTGAGASEAEGSDASAEPERWSELTSAEGRFRVELPGDPRLERSERSTLLGAVRETKYILRLGGREVAVELHDIPRLAARLLAADSILRRARDGVLSDMEAELVSDRETRQQGHPARDFTYRLSEEPPRFERARAVLVGSRIYLVTGASSGPPREDPVIARVFSSFRLWPEGEPAPPERGDPPAP